jgi:alpha-amylase/alpha-mannosidase (GH57 family)
MSAEPLRVVLCWHMHQPEYREAYGGRFMAPWTGLHAMKDYWDMAVHIQQVSGATAVFDFSPVLLDQIEDIAARLTRFDATGEPIGERLLDALARPLQPADEDQRRGLVRACLRANPKHMIERFAPYRRLAGLARPVLDEGGLHYFDDRFINDLLVWFHLAWLGETIRRDDRQVARLLDKGSDYTYADRRALLEVITDTLIEIIPTYRNLRDNDRIELATCPVSHPILPLLLDFNTAREAVPQLDLPAASGYPGGAERAAWQLKEAGRRHRRHFGHSAAGCWPSEGAVSEGSLQAMAEAGFQWAASGSRVLFNSLGQSSPPSDQAHRPYRFNDGGPVCFFRDDGLSDLIGFTYKDWHADDAVADFIRHLQNIADEPAEPGRVVSIIIDGENAWEHYPDNGYHFIGALYRKLVRHPRLKLTTFSHCLADPNVPVRTLDRLVAGSWVHGNLDTWMGDGDKNRAWDMLVAAKRAWDEAPETTRIQALEQLAVCEGSDWFWWPGEYNPATTVAEFERLFRHHLVDLYRLLERLPPEYLEHPFTRGAAIPEGGGPMRPAD